MKKLALLLVLAAACRTQTRSAPAPTAPAGVPATPRAAVEAFLQAVRNEDLQAMGSVWGTADGPAREQMDRDTMEKREVVMMCYFRHDAFRVAGDSPAAGGVRNLEVELTRDGQRRTTTFTAVPARRGGWYVQKVDLEPVADWCTRR